MMIVLIREDAEINLCALQTMTEQFQLYELGHLSSWKTALFFGYNVWIMGCT
jgi:hypothetical protein